MASKMNFIKCLIALILPIICLMQSAWSQVPGSAWEKQFSMAQSHYFSDVTELADGNVVLLGAIEMPGERKFDIWLVEMDQKGDTVRSGIINNPGNDIPFRIVKTGQDGYLVAYIVADKETGQEAGLMVVDNSFTPQWRLPAEKTSELLRTDVAVDNDGAIWWLNTFNVGGEKPGAVLWKMSPEGAKIAEVEIESSNGCFGFNIRVLPDGTLGITCQVQPVDGNASIRVIRMTTEGNIQWDSPVVQVGKNLAPQCLCCGPDNSLLIAGWAGMCYNPDALPEEQIWDYDYLLVSMDEEGKIIWTRNYNREGSEKGTAMAVGSEGRIIAGGKCETSYSGNIGPWLLEIDITGKIMNERIFKLRNMNDQVAAIICTSDQGYVIVGPGYIDTQYTLTGWVKKLNP